MFGGWSQVLDTGMGAPKHPMFLLGVKHTDPDNQPDAANLAQHQSGPLRRWLAKRRANKAQIDHAQPHNRLAAQTRRASDTHMLAAFGAVMKHLGRPRKHGSARTASHSLALHLDPAATAKLASTALPDITAADTGPDSIADISLGNVQNQNHAHSTPHPMPPEAQTDMHTDQAHAASAGVVDLEAQTPYSASSSASSVDSKQSSQAMSSDATSSSSHSMHEQTMEEPADVAAERSRVEQLWALMQHDITEAVPTARQLVTHMHTQTDAQQTTPADSDRHTDSDVEVTTVAAQELLINSDATSGSNHMPACTASHSDIVHPSLDTAAATSQESLTNPDAACQLTSELNYSPACTAVGSDHTAVHTAEDTAVVTAAVTEVSAQGQLQGSHDSNSPAILLHNLRKVYRGKDGNKAKVAVAGLSLGINKQECFGLLGPNGAGKTTTIKVRAFILCTWVIACWVCA